LHLIALRNIIVMRPTVNSQMSPRLLGSLLITHMFRIIREPLSNRYLWNNPHVLKTSARLQGFFTQAGNHNKEEKKHTLQCCLFGSNPVYSWNDAGVDSLSRILRNRYRLPFLSLCLILNLTAWWQLVVIP